jgi:RNA 2',3'-cyclic 3'-phosphodiesterase
MRLFAALPVSGDATPELTELIREFDRSDWPVRWVRPEGLHLTVKFLGEVAAGLVPEIEAALRQASRGVPAIPLAPAALGAFPGFASARVLWAGYEAEAELELLVHRVEQGCAALGFPVEGRPFRPHVTLGRVREGRSLHPRAVDALEERSLTHGFVADRLVLYESVTGPNRAAYSPLVTISLGA